MHSEQHMSTSIVATAIDPDGRTDGRTDTPITVSLRGADKALGAVRSDAAASQPSVSPSARLDWQRHARPAGLLACSSRYRLRAPSRQLPATSASISNSHISFLLLAASLIPLP